MIECNENCHLQHEGYCRIDDIVIGEPIEIDPTIKCRQTGD